MLTLNCIDKVRDAAKVNDYLILKDVRMRVVGHDLVCLCPLHKEKSPSFHINVNKNVWHCFGCQKGGDAISLVREMEGCGFEEAVTILADAFHIPIEERTEPLTEEERQRMLKRELMRNAMDTVQSYFAANLWRTDSEECKQALAYARERWSDEFMRVHGIGYALNDWQALYNYALKKGISPSLLQDIGLIKQNERGGYYDFFRGRVTIPIRTRSNRVIAHTARIVPELDVNNTPKYLHNSNTEIFKKDETLFGIHLAAGTAAKTDKCYLVEGAPDAMRLHAIGIANAVACLGSDYTDTQFGIIKTCTNKLCFIPDADVPKSETITTPLDRYGTGIRKVVEAGKRALSKGFHVLVKEIPLGQKKNLDTEKMEPCKQDPDDYFTTYQKFTDLQEEDFIIWYAEKIIDKSQATTENKFAMDEISDLICLADDDSQIPLYIEKLNTILPGKAAWKKAIDDARNRRTQKELSREGKRFSDLQEYGFIERDHGYYTTTRGGHLEKWSNFVLEPLFHIRGISSAIRLYRITNEDNVSMIVEFKQEDLNTLARFRNKVECLGNFVWLAREEQLIKLKTFLYKETESADLIKQLGWQRKGFFAFGNGIYYNNRWFIVDKQGIVRLPDKGAYYLPAFSEMYEDDPNNTFAFERTFVHLDYNSVLLHDFLKKIVSVFGENGMVAIAYLLASLFRDVVTFETKTFPVLNLFGLHGSGKSELCHALMSFFIIDNIPLNIRTSSLPSIAEAVGKCANALVHLDEFKNDIDPEKIEFLKGLWDGVGRNKVNIDSNQRETSRVDSGVLLSGQEISSKDPALLSRFVLLPFTRNQFTTQEKKRYDDLKSTHHNGCSHLTLQILRFRGEFERSFRYKYREVSLELSNELSDTVETRIMLNWAILIAAVKTLENCITLPFEYAELRQACVRMLVEQSDKSRNSDDLGKFWSGFAALVSKGRVFEDGDFRFKVRPFVRVKGQLKETVLKRLPNENTVLLVFHFQRVYDEYNLYCNRHHYECLSKESLQQYLKSAQNFLGVIASQRFVEMINGVPVYEEQPSETNPKGKVHEKVDEAYCVDYEKTRAMYEGFSISSRRINLRKYEETADDEPDE